MCRGIFLQLFYKWPVLTTISTGATLNLIVDKIENDYNQFFPLRFSYQKIDI